MNNNCSNIPRPEYPRPQMVRDSWNNLNGYWEFEIDKSNSGRDRGLFLGEGFSSKILVPFCPESKLSGVECKDFMEAVWYKREFDIPNDWDKGRIILHFGAIDYFSEVWINNVSIGTHKGGYSSFSFDITEHIVSEKNVIVVYAKDDLRSGRQPRGKQSGVFNSIGCDYTRTTGIWQTVWVENVPSTYIHGFKLNPDPANGCLHIEAEIKGDYTDSNLTICAFAEGKNIGSCSANLISSHINITLRLSEIKLWEPGNPFLYDLTLKLTSPNNCEDRVMSYFGLRTVSILKNIVYINNRPVFQRLVLDQGYYIGGIYTAPTDEDLKKDIELSIQMGFNGARLHQKVFESRYLYWADKLGYIVWGEHASWGLNITGTEGLENFLPEWVEIINRDYSHPSIVAWCPFNETWDHDFLNAPDGSWDPRGTRQNNNILKIVYEVTKTIDKTRPIVDASGNYHVITDIYDIHDYEQNEEIFASHYKTMKTGGDAYENYPQRQKYSGQPYMVSEYGGIWWEKGSQHKESWGYGKRPQNEEEFLKRYEELTKILLENPYICGFCYTQLYDVEQETNGLYTYERKPKFDTEIIKKINTQKAAIEI